MTVDVGKFLLHGIPLRHDIEFFIILPAELDIEKDWKKNWRGKMFQRAQAEKL
jgi:hypothetical protein